MDTVYTLFHVNFISHSCRALRKSYISQIHGTSFTLKSKVIEPMAKLKLILLFINIEVNTETNTK